MTSVSPTLWTVLLFLLAQGISLAQTRTNPKSQPEELGLVSWYRTYDEALAVSEKENKPVLILFQEIPGCSTCKNYGNEVLSHPLLADAIENEFIPLAIYNNKAGKDREILKKYDEPAWNNPVVRIVDKNGVDIVSRVTGNYTAKGLYTAMDFALRRKFIEIPEYFNLLGEELSANAENSQDVFYSMYCFWTGEKQLGSQDGVLNTEAGFMSGREVVKVKYNRDVLQKEDIDAFAKANKMKPIEHSSSYRWAETDEDYFLKRTNFKYLPLSTLQRTKINSALGNNADATKFLSPSQRKWFNTLQDNKLKKELYLLEITKAWKEMAY